MTEPREREPARAGLFYPAQPERCRDLLDRCLAAAGLLLGEEAPQGGAGGVAPHAGWVYSGATAASLFRTLVAAAPETFLFYGAVHVHAVDAPTIWAGGSWQTPLGPVAIDRPMVSHLLENVTDLESGPHAHLGEHSVEVMVPFVRHLFPRAQIVVIAVPAGEEACSLGMAVGRALAGFPRRTAVVASTDLTHYGERFHFSPRGTGQAAHRWSKEVNDRRMIDLVCGLQAEKIVGEAMTHRNACGPGAVAAACAHLRALGASSGRLLHQTTSHEVLPDGPARDFVGYCAIVHS